ncbi:RNA-guided endonuclease TnpB family protein [Streptomyces sp. NPDC051822]|uniref:RNA-guided endonuclease TnpB family protein n=1 Tax=Streptomyces sp. NPDC051822 TaxID=3365675 RepID=UPI0037B62EAC
MGARRRRRHPRAASDPRPGREGRRNRWAHRADRPPDRPPARRRARRRRPRLPLPGRPVQPPRPVRPRLHPRLLADSLAKLAKAQRTLSRTQPGSQRRAKAAARVARVHHQIKMRRASFLHGLSKKLATRFTHVAIEDLRLTALTASAKGSPDQPGKNVKVTARFNRHLLDAALGSLRSKLAYKTAWYGSQLVILDKAEPVAGTCAKCTERNPSSTPTRSKFHCPSCGAVVHRHENSTANIVHAARRQLTTVASDRGETLNARRAAVSPGVRKDTGQGALKREDTG